MGGLGSEDKEHGDTEDERQKRNTVKSKANSVGVYPVLPTPLRLPKVLVVVVM